MRRRDLSISLLTSAAGTMLVSQDVKSQGAPAPAGHLQTPAEAAAQVTPRQLSYAPGHLWRYQSGSFVTGDDDKNDWTDALQAAVRQAAQGGNEVIIPGAGPAGPGGAPKFYRCVRAITVASGVRIRSDGTQPTLRFHGCNGFELAPGKTNLSISGIELFSLDDEGKADPRKFDAIAVKGASGSPCHYVFCRDLYLRGWNRCIDFQFTWNSIVDNCTTINCNIGLRLLGQSCNNAVSNSRLMANGGTHSIKCEKASRGVRGEGLLISNTLMVLGAYGLQTDGFLSLDVVNCTVDLIGDTAFDFTNVPALNLSNSWIYAANYGVRYRDLRVRDDQGCTISGCRIEASAVHGTAVSVGSNNAGISILGGSLRAGPSGTARCLRVDSGADDVSIVGSHLDNVSGNPSILINGARFRQCNLLGNDTVQYAVPPAYIGRLTGCTTAPTASIGYSVAGDVVTLEIPDLTATSNATTCTITGMPVELRPLGRKTVLGITRDDGIENISRILVEPSGTITLCNALSPTFKSEGHKGIGANTITYRRF